MAAAENSARPVDYVPRRQFVSFHDRVKRWAVIVAHRRAGKTVACVMELLTRALATSKSNARYAYIAPFREQAKTVAWHYLKHYAQSVVATQEDIRESDLSVKLVNGSVVRLFGADNPNALRGMYLDGVVMDEYADMRPSLWGEVIRPTLSDRKGWAVFIGTPKGRNEFHALLHGDGKRPGAIRDQDWFTLILKASETGILPAEELADAQRTMSPEQYAQEYECSFDAPNIGAYYAKVMQEARDQNRICRVPYAHGVPVETWWDLGISDDTAIWLTQTVGKEIRCIAYYENNGEPLSHYVNWLQKWSDDIHLEGAVFAKHYLPHDARQRELGTGKTRQETLEQLGVRPIQVCPALDVLDGIENVRRIMPQVWFDSEHCARGITALEEYSRRYDDRNKVFAPHPLHNWASHGADAFRTMANLHPGRSTRLNSAAPVRDRYSDRRKRYPGATWMSG